MVNILTYSALSFFPIVGLVLLIIGIIFRRRRKVKSQSCVPVRGMLVGNVKHSDSDSTTYHPVVEYMVKGKKYSVGYRRKKEKQAGGGDLVKQKRIKISTKRIVYSFKGKNMINLFSLIISFSFIGFCFYINEIETQS